MCFAICSCDLRTASWHGVLQSECQFFRSSLDDLKMDVRYHKQEQRSNAKYCPQMVQPHCIGVTEPELRAAAGKHGFGRWTVTMCQVAQSHTVSSLTKTTT